MKIQDIAKLLPEGISEDTLDKIVSIISKTIDAQVEKKVKVLESKVTAFLRTKIDMLKEHAEFELMESKDSAKQLKNYQEIQNLVLINAKATVGDKIAEKAITESAQITEENGLLLEELTKTLEVNKQLKNHNKILKGKAIKLTETLEKLQESEKGLVEHDVPIKSSQRSVVHSRNIVKVIEKTEKENAGIIDDNPWLTEEVIANMESI